MKAARKIARTLLALPILQTTKTKKQIGVLITLFALWIVAAFCVYFAVRVEILSRDIDRNLDKIEARPHIQTRKLLRRVVSLNSRVDSARNHMGYIEAHIKADNSMVQFLTLRGEITEKNSTPRQCSGQDTEAMQ